MKKTVTWVLLLSMLVSTFLPVLPISATETSDLPKAPIALEYQLDAVGNGMADGVVTVTLPAGHQADDIYLFWGDANGKLPGYTALSPFKVGSNSVSHRLAKGSVIPKGATRLLAYTYSDENGFSEGFASVDLPANAALTDAQLGTLLYEFQSVGDIHLTTTYEPRLHHSDHMRAMLADIMAVSPNSIGIFNNGDTANNGKNADYEEFLKIYAEYPNAPVVYSGFGNHELFTNGTDSNYDKSDEAFEAMKNAYWNYLGDSIPADATFCGGTRFGSLCFSFVRENCKFIFLGTDVSSQNYLTLNDTSLTWLENELKSAAGKGNPVFIIMHHPMPGTIAGSFKDNYGVTTVTANALKTMLAKYPEVIMFNGHSHRDFDQYATNYVRDDKLPNIFGSSSVGYLAHNYNNTNTAESYKGSEGYYVYVYEDKVLVRGRDFLTHEWVASAQFLVDLSDEALETVPEKTVEAPLYGSTASFTMNGEKLNGTVKCTLPANSNATKVNLYLSNEDTGIIGSEPFVTASITDKTHYANCTIQIKNLVLPYEADYILIYSYSDTLGQSVDCDVIDLGAANISGRSLFIDDYAELEAFIASLETNNYAGETVKLNVDIIVNEGWIANDGTANAVAAPTGANAKTLDTAKATQAFAGEFDGQGHTISGLYMTGKAFFPLVNGAKIKNVTFDNCASAHDSGGHVGIVAGVQDGSSGNLEITNVVVKNSKIVNNSGAVNLGTLMGKAAKAASVKITDCQTVNCNLSSSSKSSYVGGILGHNETYVEFLRCSSDTDINAIGTENKKYNCGGMIGYANTKASITDCVNTGNIISSMYAGGMVGDTNYGVPLPITLKGCVNRGDITANGTKQYDGAARDAFAGGMFGRINNAGSCSITDSINFGKIKATNTSSGTSYAGGMAGFVDSKQDRESPAVQNCMNQGNVTSDTYAGGVMGYLRTNTVTGVTTGTNPDVVISNYVNTGDITAKTNAGGLIGKAQNVGYGTIENVITVGKITVGTTNSGCAVFGTSNLDATNLTKTNIFFSNATTDSFLPADSYMADLTAFYAENGAAKFKAFNLGKDWMLTNTIPVPAGVFARMGEKEFVEKDIDYVGYQEKVETKLTSIRMIAGLDSLEFQKTGFELYLVGAGKDARGLDRNSKTVYTALNIYDAEGNALNPYPAVNVGYRYLSAINLNGLDQSEADGGLATGVTTLIIKPYVTSTSNGVTTTSYGSACAIVFHKTAEGVVSITGQYVM